jgi:serine/threonine-protein kinase
MPLTPGTTLGSYSVTAKIGEGGMGEVYRARDTKLDRDVALKVLPEAFTSDPDRLARFEREAKVLASLNHPNIGHIYGLEEAEGTRALVLELIEGPTLADRIAQGPIPVDESLPIAKQIAEALEAAHEQGVIHRDLKPANVVVKGDGTVKVLDFGLAKAFQPDANDPSLSQSPTISLTAAATQMGMVIGTAAYMAPEQAKGLPVDKRADIWAFGAVLFEMLTGKKLFEAGDVSEMLASVLIKDPDISNMGTHVPDHVRSVVRQCLIKDPKERLRDIGDVRIAMKGVFETTASVSPTEATVPQSPGWRQALPWVAAVLLAVIASLAGFGLRPSVTSPVSRFTIPAPGLSTIPIAQPVALSPDGQTLVYNTVEDGLGQLYQRSMDQLEAVLIRGATGAAAPFFSPNGEWVGFYSPDEQALMKVSLAGGPPATLTPLSASEVRRASWGPDGTIVFARAGEHPGLWSVADTGGVPQQISPMEGADGSSYNDPRFFPDGSAVLFTMESGDGERQVMVRSLETGEQKVLLEGTSARLTTTGHLLFTREDSLWAVPFDANNLAVAGEPSPVLEGIQTTNNGVGRLALGDNGSLVYVPSDIGGSSAMGRSLVWVDRNGQETELAAEPAPYRYPRISPDGTRVTIFREDQEEDVWIWELSGETLTPLTFGPGPDVYGEWTPDSERVISSSQRGNSESLLWRAADFTGGANLISEAEGRQLANAVAPDGSVVVFARLPPGAADTDLQIVSLTDDPVTEDLLSTESEEHNAAISPNGRWFAYQSDLSGEDEVYVRSFPDAEAAGQIQISTSGGQKPVWGPDGDELFYVNDNRLWSVDISMEPSYSRGTPTMVIDDGYALEAHFGRNYDVDPDTGDRFLMVKPFGGERGVASSSINVVQNWFEELTRLVPTN